MKIYKTLLGIAAAGMLLASSVVAVAAGPFTAANNALFDASEAYYGGAEGVPDFQFTRAEFGQTELGQLIHLGAENVVATLAGYTVVYNAATDAVDVYRAEGTYSEGKEARQRTGEAAYFDCGFPMTFGSIVEHAGELICIPGSSVGTASTSPQAVYVGTTPGTARSCTFDAASDGVDVHSC